MTYTNKDMAEAYLKEAKRRLETASRAVQEEGGYAYCIRQSQECVELSLKASLRLIGVEYPKHHEVSEVLKRVKDRFPKWYADDIDELAKISIALAMKREAAMYGDDVTGKPPIALFTKADAEKALKQAQTVFKKTEKLIQEIPA